MGKVDLYALPGCPYSARVERTLKELGVTYERHDVPPDANDRRGMRRATGSTDVPAIVDRAHGIEVLSDLDEIVEHLRSTYG